MPFTAAASPSGRLRSKTVATWLALLLGSLGAHRFYLRGARDPWGWLFPLPTLAGLVGVWRLRTFGLDDQLGWLLVPALGFSLSAAMLGAIVHGLTPDARWDERHNPGAPAGSTRTGWAPVLGVILALMLGAGVLMGTLAFAMQHYFEWAQAAR